MQFSSWEIHFVIVCLLAWPVGRVFLSQGIFGPVLVGLIVIAIPTATVANFNAKLSSELLALSAWLTPLFACFLLLLKHGIPKSTNFITSAALTSVFTTSVFLALYIFDQTQYVMPGPNELLYNSHDGYFAAVPFELLRAEYGSRLRVANLYPVEWKTYYFLGGSIAANFLKGVEQLTLIHFYNSKLLIAVLCYFSIIESIIICANKNHNQYNYQFHFCNKFLKLSHFLTPLAFVTFLLLWWYGESFFWNMNTSGGLAITAGFLFFYFRLNNLLRESYLWLAIAAVAGFRNAPPIAMAFPFLLYLDFWPDLKKILSFKKQHWKKSFLNISSLVWPATSILFFGLIYCFATLGSSQDSPFNLPNLRFKLSWWYLSPICSAFLEVLSGFISKVPAIGSRFHGAEPVGILSVLALFILFFAQAFLNKSKTNSGKQLRIMKPIIFSMLAIGIAGALLNQVGSNSPIKPEKFVWEVIKDLIALMLILILPMHLFNLMLPERDSKVLIAITIAHLMIFAVTINNVGVAAYQFIYYCYLAALVWMWTSALTKKTLLLLSSVVVLAIIGGGPWFNIGDIYKKQSVIDPEYVIKLQLVEAKGDLIENTNSNGIFCGTGQYLKDDATASYFGVRRGWNSKIALENRHEIISLRMSEVTSSHKSRAAFSSPESDYCK